MTILPSGAKLEGSSMAASRMRQRVGKVMTARAHGPRGEIMIARKMRSIPTTRGGNRKQLHQREQNCPPHRKGDENTDGSISRKAHGSPPLEEKGREESCHDVKDGHSESVDQPEAHIEESGRRTVLPGPIPVFGV